MKTGNATNQLSNLFQGLAALLLAASPTAFAFQSGSTGADGAFSPTVNTEVQLPPSGVFNYTTVNIPVGVTVTYKRNVANTPVVILASGDVTIAGTINISGGNAKNSGAAGDGNLGDDGIPGIGGPGGFDGGQGGAAGTSRVIAGAGLGPGGGAGGYVLIGESCDTGAGSSYGAGGGFGSAGVGPGTTINCTNPTLTYTITSGAAYGSSQLLPLIGGSGGGGGGGGISFIGAGGGGGAGAVLIASSGTVNVTGSILANGGNAGSSSGTGSGLVGGGGSGGAIRIVASTIAGNGTISANSGTSPPGYNGGVGRIRFESDSITRTSGTTPAFTFAALGVLFVTGFPSLKITSVAGVAAPANPTGSADITLPSNTVNPVTVAFSTTSVPVGNVVKLTVTPQNGAVINVTSTALTGTNANATSTVLVSLPSGPSVLSAQTTYTIVASLGDELSRYAQGERVEQVRLSATLNGESTATLITVSGKEFGVPTALLASAGIGQ